MSESSPETAAPAPMHETSYKASAIRAAMHLASAVSAIATKAGITIEEAAVAAESWTASHLNAFADVASSGAEECKTLLETYGLKLVEALPTGELQKVETVVEKAETAEQADAETKS